MLQYEKIIKQLNNKLGGFKAEIGVILGSGWGEVTTLLKNIKIIKYEEITGMPKTTVKGHKGNFIFGEINGKKVAFIQGRFHLYEGYDISSVVMPVKILKSLGVKTLIITNSAGAVNEKYNVGDIVVVNDHINFTGKNPLIGLKPTETCPIFIDMCSPYNLKLSEKAYNICLKNNFPVHYGTYFQFMGPSYETPAEIKMARMLGGDLVGMSTAIETIMANYEKLCVVCISCICNKTAGMRKDELTHSEVLAVTEDNKDKFKIILNELINAI